MTLVLLAAGMWDYSVKQTSLDGYCPADARYIAAAEDFGKFWAGVEQSDAWHCIYQEMGYPVGPAVLDIRKATGIRPTPFRWSIWMGSRFLASDGPSGCGVCVHPGLLLRAVSRLRALTGTSHTEGGISRFGEYWYSWRDEFLILSTSKDYVSASLAASSPSVARSKGRDELRLMIPGAHDALFRLYGQNGWPVEGQIRVATSVRKAPLTLVNAWPATPVCTITAPHWTDAATILDVLDEPLRGMPWRNALGAFARTTSQHWAFESLPGDWDAQTDECAFALTAIDTAETLPVPSLAVLLRASAPQIKTHPLAALLSSQLSVPYEWGGQKGVAARIVGEKLTLCMCRSGKLWLATSNEPLMASLAGKTQDGDPVDADLAIRVDWKQLGAVMEKLLGVGGELELFPGQNKVDLERETLPIVKALGRMGSLRIDGKNQGALTEFSGYLAFAPTQREAADK